MTVAVRPPAVAGLFYPADATELRRWVCGALDEAARRPRAGWAAPAAMAAPTPRAPQAIVAPHAGYVYSGAVAASAYALVAPRRGHIQRVVLLGPAHRSPLRAVAVSSADAFATPLGLVPVDTAARDDLLVRGLVVEDDAAHAGEHSLEVHLPFLQVALGEVTILPLAVGAVAAGEVAALLDHVWGGPESLVVVSTDLSHYLDSVTATALDRETAAAVTARRYEELGTERACGAYPLRGLLAAADRRGLNVELLALRNSSDVDGRGERVVGYGAFAVG